MYGTPLDLTGDGIRGREQCQHFEGGGLRCSLKQLDGARGLCRLGTKRLYRLLQDTWSSRNGCIECDVIRTAIFDFLCERSW